MSFSYHWRHDYSIDKIIEISREEAGEDRN